MTAPARIQRPDEPAMPGARPSRDRHLPRQAGHGDHPHDQPGRRDPAAPGHRPRQGAAALTETSIRTRAGIAAWIRGWVRSRQRGLSARVHAAADDHARSYGWTITETSGRFGFAARSYRDPRFDQRRQQLALAAGAPGTCRDAAPARRAEE